MKRILLTGGAGYIGSHAAWQLAARPDCEELVVLDNLYSGHEWALPPQAKFYVGDIRDAAQVGDMIREHGIDAVLHFAGHVEVNESLHKPAKYYDNNVVGSLNLIQTSIDNGVRQFVFSSSAAVYGAPAVALVDEDCALQPINPYGQSKLMTEWMLHEMARAQGQFRYVALRYFNVAGAADSGNIGQATPAATHLIKVACEVACGLRPTLQVFGDDYPTADGTCVRDYIHVDDLVEAHVDALRYLEAGGDSLIANCGYGRGYSVKQVVDTVRQVSGVDFAVEMAARRAGDPPQLIADNRRVRQILGWQPQRDDLALICRSAYRWENTLQQRRQNPPQPSA